MFGFRRKKMSCFPSKSLIFFVYNVFKRYETVFLQESQKFFSEKASGRMCKFIENSFLAHSQRVKVSWLILKSML